MIAFAKPSAGASTAIAAAHLDASTALLTALLLLVGLFFVARRDLWGRLWWTRCDPRPLGMFRIVFGLVVLWTLLDLLPYARFLFSDEGLWLTKLARKRYGAAFSHLWDPAVGFEHLTDLVPSLLYGFSLLHVRSDPFFVFLIFGLAIVSAALMTLGVRTRLTTVTTWLLVDTIYRHNLVFYSGADTAMRVFLFLGMLSRWGEAYSLDSWRRYRRAITAGEEPPRGRLIPGWSTHAMMLQLAVIYCTTGLLKTGASWRDGTALYYATSLEHFFRAPEQIIVVTWLQRLWILPISSRVTLVWEMLFPLVLVGCALRVFEAERARGVWVGDKTSRVTRWLSYALLVLALACGAALAWFVGYYYVQKVAWWRFGRRTTGTLCSVIVFVVPLAASLLYGWVRRARPEIASRWIVRGALSRWLWLGWGVLFHLGIELLLNVGIFVQVMLAPYLVWLSADELARAWAWLGTRADPSLPRHRWLARLRHRAPRPRFRVRVPARPLDVRRAALLRPWDLCGRLEFELVGPDEPSGLSVDVPAWRDTSPPARCHGVAAARALCWALPAFWVLLPLTWIPLARRLVGALLLRVVAPADADFVAALEDPVSLPSA